MPESDNERAELLERIHHTDSRVTAMETKVDAMAGGISRIESAVLNKQPVNIVAWVGVMISIVTLVSGGFLLMTGYVQLTLEPVWADLADVEDDVANLQEDTERHNADISVLKERVLRMDEFGSSQFNDYRNRQQDD